MAARRGGRGDARKRSGGQRRDSGEREARKTTGKRRDSGERDARKTTGKRRDSGERDARKTTGKRRDSGERDARKTTGKRRDSGERDARRDSGQRTARRSSEEMRSKRSSGELRATGKRSSGELRATGRRSSGGMRRASGAMPPSKGGPPPWLIPAGIGLGVGVIALAVMVMSAGKTKPSGDPVASQSSATESSAVSSSEMDEESRLAREQQVTDLDALAAELEAGKTGLGQLIDKLQRAKGAARSYGFDDLFSKANALVDKARKLRPVFAARQMEEELVEVRKAAKEGALLDAIEMLEDTARRLEDEVDAKAKATLIALRGDLAKQRTAVIDGFKTRIEGAIGKGDWNKVNNLLLELELVGEAGDQLVSHYNETLPERKKKYFAERLVRKAEEERIQGQAAYAKAKQTFAALRAKRLDMLSRRTQLARDLSIKTLRLRDQSSIIDAKIDEVQTHQLLVSGKHRGKPIARQPIDWSLLDPRARIDIDRKTLTEDDLEGHLELGRFCIIHGRFDDAEKAYAKAKGIDPEVPIPDIASFRVPPRLSAGKEQRIDDRIKVHYDWSKAEFDERDFSHDGGRDEVGIKDGKLSITSRTTISVDVPMEPPINFRFVPDAGCPRAGAILTQIRWQTDEELSGVTVAYRPKTGRYAVLQSTMPALLASFFWYRRVAPDAFEEAPKDAAIRVQADDEKVMIVIGDTVAFEAAAKSVAVAVTMHVFELSGKARFPFSEFTLEGKLSKADHKKILDERKANRVRKLRQPKPRKAPVAAEEDEAGDEEDDGLIPLLEPDRIARLGQREALQWKDIVSKLRSYVTTQHPLRLREARQALDKFAEDHPGFEGVPFYRGFLALRDGQLQTSIKFFRAAVTAAPDFLLARSFEVVMLRYASKYDEAATACQEILKRNPGEPQARMEEALIAFYKRTDRASAESALEMAEVAALLAPGSAYLQTQVDQLRAILRGPPWPGGKPIPVRSQNFVVHTDLSKQKAKQMLDVLEKLYEQIKREFPPPPGFDWSKERPGEVYVSKTRATFTIFREQSLGSRGDNALGYYHPGFKDVHLFLDTDDGSQRSEMLDTLRHEAWHQYIARFVPGIPRWLNEGLAEYWGAMTFKDGKPHHGLQEGRIKSLMTWVEAGEAMPLREMLHSTTSSFMNYGPGYGHAWSLVHLAFVHKPDSYKKVFMDYINAMARGTSQELAFQETFGRIDITAMERDWLQMLRGISKKE